MFAVLAVVLAVAVAFVIAAAVIGREARRLDAVPPRPVFDMDEAVEYVANHLPVEVAAELSHADVRRILDWNLDYLRAKGASGNGHAGPSGRQGPPSAVVVGGAEAVDSVMRRARESGADYSPAHLHLVLDQQLRYLEAIGAVGPEAEG